MRNYLLILLFLFNFSGLLAQRWKLTRYEAIAGVGFANYFGDIGGTSPTQNNLFGLKDINLLTTRPALMVGARYKTTEITAVKFNLVLIMISGTDRGGDNFYRRYRFNTFGIEHTLQYERAIIKEERRRSSFALYNRRGLLSSYSNKGLYVFGGLGGIVHYNDIWREPSNYTPKIDVVKKGFHYSGTLMGGVMVKFLYDNRYAFSAEMGLRYVLSDYLDGLTTSVSRFNDIYYYTNFSIIYRIKTSRKGYPILFRRYY
ncbi:MAG: hypothetical protein N2662_06275 [Bacteroidales bacterium]|nr:hypothetical protein [Bacteroidales bacterium]